MNIGELLQLRGHTKLVNSVAISPDGTMAISASDDKTLICWDISSGKQVFVLKGHTRGVRSVAISPNGKTAISASSDKTLICWDISSGKQVFVLKGHTKAVTSVAISPDGTMAISASDDKTLICWRITDVKENPDTEEWKSAVQNDSKKIAIFSKLIIDLRYSSPKAQHDVPPQIQALPVILVKVLELDTLDPAVSSVLKIFNTQMEILSLKSKAEGWSPEVLFLQGKQHLEDILRSFKSLHDTQKNVFLSYAWYTDAEINEKLQDRLKMLKKWLLMAGVADVFLDISGDIFGDINLAMRTGMEKANFVISIGTPQLKKRAQEVGTNLNNLQFELGFVWDRCQREPNFLIPVLFDGDFGTAFPSALLSTWAPSQAETTTTASPSSPSGESKKLGIKERVVNLEEIMLGEISEGPWAKRISALEEAILGEVQSGGMSTRLDALEASV